MPVGQKEHKIYLGFYFKKDEGVADITVYDNETREKSYAKSYSGTIREMGKVKNSWEGNEFVEYYIEFTDNPDHKLNFREEQFNTVGFLNQLANLQTKEVAFGVYVNDSGFFSTWMKDEAENKVDWLVPIGELVKAKEVEIGSKKVWDWSEPNKFWTEKMIETCDRLGVKWHDKTINDSEAIGGASGDVGAKKSWIEQTSAFLAKMALINGQEKELKGKDLWTRMKPIAAELAKSVDDRPSFTDALVMLSEENLLAADNQDVLSDPDNISPWVKDSEKRLEAIGKDLAGKAAGVFVTIYGVDPGQDDDLPF